jgi:hypothetical protein
MGASRVSSTRMVRTSIRSGVPAIAIRVGVRSMNIANSFRRSLKPGSRSSSWANSNAIASRVNHRCSAVPRDSSVCLVYGGPGREVSGVRNGDARSICDRRARVVLSRSASAFKAVFPEGRGRRDAYDLRSLQIARGFDYSARACGWACGSPRCAIASQRGTWRHSKPEFSLMAKFRAVGCDQGREKFQGNGVTPVLGLTPGIASDREGRSMISPLGLPSFLALARCVGVS